MTFMPFRVHVCGLRRSKVNRTAEVDVLTRFFQNELGCNVEHVSLMVDNKSGRSRGFAFVDFKDAVSLDKALALDPASQSARKLADSVTSLVTVKMSKQLTAAVKVQRWWRFRSSRTPRNSVAECGVVGEHRRGGEGGARARDEGEPTAERDASRLTVNTSLNDTFFEYSSSPPFPALQSRGKTWPFDESDLAFDKSDLEQAIQQLLDSQVARLDEIHHAMRACDTPAR